MVAKEFVASVHHVSRMFRQYSYVDQLTQITNSFQQANNSINPVYDPVLTKVDELISKTINYESATKFPFDGNPYVALMGIGSYLGVGALENLKIGIQTNPSEAERLLLSAKNKLQACEQTTSALQRALKSLPGYAEAIEMYVVSEDRVVVRLVLPDDEVFTLDESSRHITKLLNSLKQVGRLDKRDEAAYQFEVIALSHSSPEEVLLALAVKTGLVLNIIFKTLLKRWREVEEIRNLRAKTEKINAETESTRAHKKRALEALGAIEEESIENNKQLAQKIVEEFGDELDGAKNEVTKGIEESIGFVENLIVNGGTVNVYLGPAYLEAKDPQGWRQELIENRKVQSKLESSQKLLNDSSQ